MPVPPHPSFNSSRLVRSLAGLGIADVPDSPQTFAERLSAWVGWTDAPVLLAALAVDAAAPPVAGVAPDRQALIDEVQRVRRELAQSIETDAAFSAAGALASTSARRRSGIAGAGAASLPPAAQAEAELDPASARRRHAVLQQLMDDRIRPLRERVRAALTAATPALAKLAALDAAFEHALSARERPLLAGAAVLAESRNERRREARSRTGGETPATSAAEDRRAMRELVLAELDLRLQPIDGLIAALQQHTAPPTA